MLRRIEIKLSISENAFSHFILSEEQIKKAKALAKMEGLAFSHYVARLILHDIEKRGFLIEK